MGACSEGGLSSSSLTLIVQHLIVGRNQRQRLTIVTDCGRSQACSDRVGRLSVSCRSLSATGDSTWSRPEALRERYRVPLMKLNSSNNHMIELPAADFASQVLVEKYAPFLEYCLWGPFYFKADCAISPYSIFSTISPIARLAVKPGLSMPKRLTNPGKPSSFLM